MRIVSAASTNSNLEMKVNERERKREKKKIRNISHIFESACVLYVEIQNTRMNITQQTPSFKYHAPLSLSHHSSSSRS